MKALFLTAACILFTLLPASAGFRGSIDFTPAEIAAHRRYNNTIVDTARDYLNGVWNDHVKFYRANGVSKYYGDRNNSLDTRRERIAALRNAGKSTALVDSLQPTSCIGLCLGALRAGFNAPGDQDLASAWSKIETYARANELDGCAVLDALQKLGWRILYWNPSPRDNERWDREDGTRASRGWHAWRYLTVMRNNMYYFNRVDDKTTLVGFDTTIPAAFRNVRFFVGVAHTGYHVFPGFSGEIIEAHSTRALTSFNNLEESPFNPLKNGGGPRWTATERYRSGIIGIPPQ